MLTPMLVQYLVALCCLRANPDAIDVTVGDYVRDDAAQKDRDVDVTVTVADANGTTTAFKGFEVKREGTPLDVSEVEQLCAKLRDMPTITHRAIVSSSGFTEPAVRKATAYGVKLYAIRPWVRPIGEQFPEFENVGHPEQFLVASTSLLYWIGHQLNLRASKAPGSFVYSNSAALFGKAKKPHRQFKTLLDLQSHLLLDSTGILLSLDPAQMIQRTFPFRPLPNVPDVLASPAWPHTHSLDVRDLEVYLKFEESFAQLEMVTISGHLQWQSKPVVPQFHLLEGVPGGEVFSGAAVTESGSPDGSMWAMIFGTDSRTVGIHRIDLLPKHRNMISKLKIPITRGVTENT